MPATAPALPPCEHPPCAASPVPWSAADLAAAARMCQAMSDPARLRLLLHLAHTPGELCVSELVQREGPHEEARLGSVSARLQALHAACLVSRRREARHVYYRLADAHVRVLLRNVLEHAAET